MSWDDPPAGLPSAVMIKRVEDPHGVLAEQAGLTFTNELPAVRPLVPRLLAVDRDRRLIVMSDEAREGTRVVGDLLFDDDREAAVDALRAAQAALGRFGAGGFGERSRYDRIAAALPGLRASRHNIHRLEELLAGLADRFAGRRAGQLDVGRPGSPLGGRLGGRLGAALPDRTAARLADELRTVREELFTPGPFVTASHGDATVGNILHTPGRGVVFVDLETVGYRHALLDGSFARLRYLHSVWAQELPVALQRTLLEAYRAELAAGCPQAYDEKAFGRALVAGCAAWLAALCSQLDRVADRDVRWGRATYRQRIAVALRHFAVVAEEYHELPALGDAAILLHDRLTAEWDHAQCALPIYPALADPREPTGPGRSEGPETP